MNEKSPSRQIESRFGFGNKKENPKDLRERWDRYKLEKKVEQQHNEKQMESLSKETKDLQTKVQETSALAEKTWQ